jgi:hypothetical protein
MMIRNGDLRPPNRRPLATPHAEAPRIWGDRDERALARAREPGKAVVAHRLREQRARERQIGGKGDEGEAAAIESLRLCALRVRARGDEGEEQCNQRSQREAR